MRRFALTALATIAAAAAWAGSVPAGAVVYDIEPDYRLCPSPACGGYWVDEVNLGSSACHDGSIARRCYVADIDLSNLRLSPRAEARVRREISQGNILFAGTLEQWPSPVISLDLGVLVVDKVWWDPTN